MYHQRDTSNYKPANLTEAKPKSLWRSIKAGTAAVVITGFLVLMAPLWPLVLAITIAFILFGSFNK